MCWRTCQPTPSPALSLSVSFFILPSICLFWSSNDYLLSSGLMACGLIGPVRMGLVVARGADLSDSVRSDGAPWWFEVMLSVGLPASIRVGLLTGALSCCCSEKNLWVDCNTSALCLAWEREKDEHLKPIQKMTSCTTSKVMLLKFLWLQGPPSPTKKNSKVPLLDTDTGQSKVFFA